MNNQRTFCVITLILVLIMGCESNKNAIEVQPTSQQPPQTPLESQLEQTPSSVSSLTPTESSTKASTEPLNLELDKQNSTLLKDNTNQLALNPYSLDKIEEILKKDKTVFDIIESPNKKAIAYMVSKTGMPTPYDDMTLQIWNVGDEKPRSAIGKLEFAAGDVFWSPNSDYVFVDTGTYVIHEGSLYSATTLDVVGVFEYFNHVYFSSNGKYIVYSSGYDPHSTIKTVKGEFIKPEQPFDLVLYNMETHQNTVLLKGTETKDYFAIGWLDSNMISYRVSTYSAENKNLHWQDIQYSYDLSSQQIKADPTQKSPTIDDHELYAPIINAYAALVRSGYTSFNTDLIGDSLLAVSKGSTYNFGWDTKPTLMYAYYDINDDGSPELLIGADKYICGIYVLQNGTPVSVIQVEDRHNLRLLKDINGNSIIEDSWGHMGYATEFFYTIDGDRKLVSLVKLLTNGDDKKGDKFIGHFRAKDILGKEVSITEEEYCSLIRKYGSTGYEPLEDTGKERMIDVTWKPVATE